MHKDETETDLGTISLHNNVIASISSIAACEIEGVKRIGTNMGSSFLELFGKKTPSIKVEIDKSQQVSVIIPLIIKYGFNIPDISNRVQENVRNAIEKMTSLSVKEINIKVRSIETT